MVATHTPRPPHPSHPSHHGRLATKKPATHTTLAAPYAHRDYIKGENSTVPRDNIPMGMDYVDGEGVLIMYTHDAYYKFMIFDDCCGWYLPSDGNATVIPAGYDYTTDAETDAWCSANPDTNMTYKLYDLSQDPSETTNLIANVAFAPVLDQMQDLFCTYFKPVAHGGHMVESAYVSNSAYHDTFVAGYHNDRFVTYYTDGAWTSESYRYPINEYYSKPDFCDEF